MTHKDTTADDSWFTIMTSMLGLQPESWWHHCRWYGQLLIMTSLPMVMGLQSDLASFSGRSHLQYFITCSIQTWREKAWEIWSCAVMLDRHMGGGAWQISRPEHSQGSLLFTTPEMVRRKIGIATVSTVGYHPCVSTLCLSNVTAHDQISQAFPLCICILQILEVGTDRNEATPDSRWHRCRWYGQYPIMTNGTGTAAWLY